MKRLFAAAIVLCAVPAFAAYDAFIQIRGLQAQSPDASHPGWVGVSGFRWGATTPGTPGCASGEFGFTLTTALMEQEGIYYFFKHSADGHTTIPEVTIEYSSVRHVLENAIVRSVGGNTVAIHFARCRTHPVPQVVPTGVVPNTTTRPEPPPAVAASLVVPNTTAAPSNAQLFVGTTASERFNLVALRPQGNNTAVLKIREAAISFFQQAFAARTRSSLKIQTQSQSFTFSDCLISSYSRAADGTATVGLTFTKYDGSPAGFQQ